MAYDTELVSGSMLDTSQQLPAVNYANRFDTNLPLQLIVVPGMVETVDACKVAFDSLSDALQVLSDDCREACQTATGECCSCIENSLEKTLVIADQAITYTQGKVWEAFGRAIGDMMEYANAAGVQLGFEQQSITLPQPVIIPPQPPGIPGLPPPIVIQPPGPIEPCPPGTIRDNQGICRPIEPPPPPPPPPTGDNCNDPPPPCNPPVPNTPCNPTQAQMDWLNSQLHANYPGCEWDPAHPELGPINTPCYHMMPGGGRNDVVLQVDPQTSQAFSVPCPIEPEPPAGESCGCPVPPTVSQNEPPTWPNEPATICTVEGLHNLAEKLRRGGQNQVAADLSQAFGTQGVLGGNISLYAFLNKPADVVSSIISASLSNIFSFVTGLVDDVRKDLLGNLICSSADYTYHSVKLAAVKTINQFTGAIPTGEISQLERNLDYICPWKIPSTQQFNSMRLQGLITKDQWKDFIRFGGDCEEWQEKIIDLQDAQPTISDAVTLHLRDVIDDEKYKALLRENDVDADKYSEQYLQLRDVWPTGDEAIRWATNGLFDESFTEKYGLLEGADVLQNDDVKKYLKAAGLQDTNAQKRWMETRQLPSIGQILEWLNRLRPGRKTINDPLPNVDFTEDDAKELLKYKGIPAGFHDKILAMRHKPISFRHIAKSYIFGKMDDEDVIDAYKSMGYSDDVADALGGGLIQDNSHKKAEYEGKVPEKIVRKAYDTSVVDDDKATLLLIDLGYNFDIASQRVQTWSAERQVVETMDLVKVIKRRYMRGDFSESELNQKLIAARVDPTRVTTLVHAWTEQREANTKIPAVQQLCGWFGNGLITAQEYVTRLQNLGWKPEDALKIAGKCIGDKVAADIKAAIAALEKEQRKAKADERERQKKLKELAPCKPRPKPICPPRGPLPG
jgi:hypothetical protein